MIIEMSLVYKNIFVKFNYYDEKEKLLDDIFSKSGVVNIELFSFNINVAIQQWKENKSI